MSVFTHINVYCSYIKKNKSQTKQRDVPLTFNKQTNGNMLNVGVSDGQVTTTKTPTKLIYGTPVLSCVLHKNPPSHE